MTPDTQQARRVVPGGDAPRYPPAPARPGPIATPQIDIWSAAARQPTAPTRTRAEARRAKGDASIVRVIPLLAVLVVVAAGVYIAWHRGSAGGGVSGAVGGAALLAAAIARLMLPSRLVGLLATRKRVTDVITLTVLGACLLAAGLVLPQ
jgi:Protein of unknown function (DUF3017)